MIYLKQKVYSVGGFGSSDSQNSMDIYDTYLKTWTKQSIPFNVSEHCMTQLSPNEFILIGGEDRGANQNVITRKFQSNNSFFYISQRKNLCKLSFLNLRVQQQLGYLTSLQRIGRVVQVFLLRELSTAAFISRTTMLSNKQWSWVDMVPDSFPRQKYQMLIQ